MGDIIQLSSLSETSDIEPVTFKNALFGLAKGHRGCPLWEKLGMTCTSAVSCRSAEAYRCSTVASGSCMTNKEKLAHGGIGINEAVLGALPS